jgi:hypothetical protein
MCLRIRTRDTLIAKRYASKPRSLDRLSQFNLEIQVFVLTNYKRVWCVVVPSSIDIATTHAEQELVVAVSHILLETQGVASVLCGQIATKATWKQYQTYWSPIPLVQKRAWQVIWAWDLIQTFEEICGTFLLFLEKFNMNKCNPGKTPIGVQNLQEMEMEFREQTPNASYRQGVVALTYLCYLCV